MPPRPIYPRDKEMGQFRWSSELFNRKIKPSLDPLACYEWIGSRGPQGPLYGVRKIQPDGTDRAQMTQARRVLYAEHTGQWLPAQTAVYHACGNRNCMNIQHYTLQRPESGRQLPNSGYTPKQRAKPGPKPGSKRNVKIKPGEAN